MYLPLETTLEAKIEGKYVDKIKTRRCEIFVKLVVTRMFFASLRNGPYPSAFEMEAVYAASSRPLG